MVSNCPNCLAAIDPLNSGRCGSCGRSLAQVILDPNQTNSSTGLSSGASTTPGAAAGNLLSQYIVHIIIAALCGIAGAVLTFGFLGRIIRRHSDNPAIWIILFIVGFCLPAAYGFHYSYKQDLIAKRRKRDGIKSMK